MKKKPPFSPPEPGPMSARGLQHRTIGLRAWRAPIRADFQKIENPLVHSKRGTCTRLSPAGHCFRFDSIDEEWGRGRRGAIEKAVRTSMAAARDSGSTRGNPLVRRGGSNRSAKKSGRRQTTADPHPFSLHPELKFDFRRKSRWTCPQRAETGHLMMDYFQGEDLRCSNKNEVWNR